MSRSLPAPGAAPLGPPALPRRLGWATGGRTALGVRPSSPSAPDPRVALIMATLIVATEVLFVLLDTSRDYEVMLASALMSAALMLQVAFATPASMRGPAAQIVLIFDWLFLDVAPKVQLIASPHVLVNTSTLNDSQIAATFMVCASFVLCYTFAFYFFVRRAAASATRARPAATAASRAAPGRTLRPMDVRGHRGIAIMCVLLLSLAAVVVGLKFAWRADADSAGMGPVDMIIRKFVLMLPVTALLILVDETIRHPTERKFSRYAVLGFLALLLVLTQNPVTEKRNALGAIYITLILVSFPRITSRDWGRFVLLMAGMVIVFPTAALYTHSHRLGGVQWSEMGRAMADHYVSTHYDAWSNIYTALEMARNDGIEWGRQLLGAVLFFVPSSIWPDKPLASGIFIGDYLIRHYAMWFTNLSAPLVAEAVLDFGPAGVVIYAIALALGVRLLERPLAREGSPRLATYPMVCFFSVYVMFLLRGSLMIAFAYGAGALAAFLVIRTILEVPDRLRVRALAWNRRPHAAAGT